jgi:hypothetical protein
MRYLHHGGRDGWESSSVRADSLLGPSLIELRRARALVIDDVLRHFQRAAVLEEGSDPDRAEGMAPGEGLISACPPDSGSS